MEQSKRDLSGVQDSVKESLKGLLDGFVSGAASDLEQFAHQIAVDMTIAIDRGDEALVEELKDQAVLLVEENRLRVLAAKSDAFMLVLTGGIDAIFRVAIAALAV